ncbi:hypothetical protein LINPERHAP2_LOCUS32359, partial [Linum perenne]
MILHLCLGSKIGAKYIKRFILKFVSSCSDQNRWLVTYLVPDATNVRSWKNFRYLVKLLTHFQSSAVGGPK